LFSSSPTSSYGQAITVGHTTRATRFKVERPRRRRRRRPGAGFVNFRVTRGRCYDRNFLRLSPTFGEKIGVFLKNQCYDNFLKKLALFWVKNANFLAEFFGENI
jgi:hypothetical protein